MRPDRHMEDRRMLNRSYDTTDADEMDVTTNRQYSGLNRVAAVFDNREDAERAIDWLRSRGVRNDNISVMAQDSRQTAAMSERTGAERVDDDPGSDMARGAGTGLAAGAGVGALFGLAAAMIPGIGPFITAGALANALGAAGGGAVAGAIVGGTSGAIAGALSKWGLDKADAEYYGGEIERGATFVAVDLDGSVLSRAEAEDAFRRFNGRWASA
jgi:hypothetical protein